MSGSFDADYPEGWDEGAEGGHEWRATALVVSANELSVTARKAMLSARVPAGVAVDLADAVCRLAADGHNACAMLTAALEDGRAPETPAQWTFDGMTARAPSAHILLDGPSLFDLARCGYSVEVMIAHPALLAGLDAGAEGVRMSSRSTAIASSARVEVLPADREANPPPPPAGAIAVDRFFFSRLQSHAKGILVPADDHSRADAGSAKPDND